MKYMQNFGSLIRSYYIFHIWIVMCLNSSHAQNSSVEMTISHPFWMDNNLRILGPSSATAETYLRRFASPGISNHFRDMNALVPHVMVEVGHLRHVVSITGDMIRVQSSGNDNVFSTIFLSDGTMEISAAYRSPNANFHMSDVIRFQWKLAFTDVNRPRWATTEWVPSNIRVFGIENRRTLQVLRDTERQVQTASVIVNTLTEENSRASTAITDSHMSLSTPSEHQRLFIAAQGALIRLNNARADLTRIRTEQMRRLLYQTDNGRSTWRIARIFGLQVASLQISDNTINFHTERVDPNSEMELPVRQDDTQEPLSNNIVDLPSIDHVMSDSVFNRYRSDLRRLVRSTRLSRKQVIEVIIEWFESKITPLENALIPMTDFKVGFDDRYNVSQLTDIKLESYAILLILNIVHLEMPAFHEAMYIQEMNGTKSLRRRLQSIFVYLNDRGY